MDGDMLSMAFKMIKELGLKRTLKFILNTIPEPPSLVAVQEGFHDVVRGDHLVYKTSMGWNMHFYVMDNLGGGNLKVCGCFLAGNDNLLIEEELIFKPGQAQNIKVEERTLCDANITIQKLKKKLHDKTASGYNEECCRIDVFKRQRNYYDFLFNNSEHFVNYVKTGQATCQIAIEIESFIKKHLIVQALRIKSIEMLKIIVIHSSWATIVEGLCVLALKHCGMKSVQGGLEGILLEVAKTTTIQATKSVTKSIVKGGAKATVTQATKSFAKEVAKEGGKATAVQATKSVAKEVAKEGGKATAVQATKSVAKEVAKEGGKATAVQATKSVAKEVMKEGGKVATTQGVTKAVVQEVSKEVLEEGGKAATNQAAKSTAKAVVQETSKEVLKQGTTNTTAQVAKTAASNAVKQTFKGTVIAGVIIEGAFYSASMGKAIYKRHTGKMDHEEFVDFAVEQTATSGGSAAGGIGGSLAGAAAGAAIGSVVPVIGTMIGATIGGIAGGVSGGVGGSLFGKGIGKLINFGRKHA